MLPVVVILCALVWARPVISLVGFQGEALDFSIAMEYPDAHMRKGVQGKPEMPEVVTGELLLERFGRLRLRLVRQRFGGVASSTVMSSDGTSHSTTRYDNKDVFFYFDKSARASVACDLRMNERSGRRECRTSMLISVGNHSCYIGGVTKKADCTPKVYGKLEEPRLYRTAELRSSNYKYEYGLLKPGFKVMEYVPLIDGAIMKTFYERNPTDPILAQMEASMYFTLLANEINVFYDSLRVLSRNKLQLYVYPTTVIMPQKDEDFDWSAKCNDGDAIVMDDVDCWFKYLSTMVGEIIRTFQVEHVLVMTSYRLMYYEYEILGMAFLSTVCNAAIPDEYHFSINQFNDADGAATYAHEMGHALGAKHDESAGCPDSKHLMTQNTYYPDASEVDDFFSLSKCSYRQIKKHLKRTSDKCTEDNGFTDLQFKLLFCAGFLGNYSVSADWQCQIRTGFAGSVACMHQTVNPVGCYIFGYVMCTNKAGSCDEKLGIVWNGTPCGTDKFCFRGACVNRFDVCPKVPCTCCGYISGRKRRKCCKAGRNKHKKDCYCCGKRRNENPPAGWHGPRY